MLWIILGVAGAIGVDMGRNIFQSTNPVDMIKAANAIVHKKYNPKEAYDLFKSKRKNKRGFY